MTYNPKHHPERFLRGGDSVIAETLESLRWIAQDLPEEHPDRTALLGAAYVLVEEQKRRAAWFTKPEGGK